MTNHCKPAQSPSSWGPSSSSGFVYRHWVTTGRTVTATERKDGRCKWSRPRRGRYNVWKSLLTKQQWQKNCSQTQCQGTLQNNATRRHRPAGERQLLTWRKVLWGPNAGACHVSSPTKARRMHQQTEEVTPGRTVVWHKPRPCLALPNQVCDDGENQFISYQLVWGWQISRERQTEQSCLEELWWDLNKPCKSATQGQMKCGVCKYRVIQFRDAHSDCSLDTSQDFQFTALFQEKNSSMKKSAQCSPAVKKSTSKISGKNINVPALGLELKPVPNYYWSNI